MNLRLWFDHGLGDCVNFAHVLQLYQRRGYSVQLHYADDKALVWRAAGTEWVPMDGTAYVHWTHPSGWGDAAQTTFAASKIAHNLNLPPLPELGTNEELWRELCDVTLSARDLVPESSRAAANAFLETLPRPIVLLHTHGNTSPEQKNIPDSTSVELYEHLLGLGAGLVLLDWDNRVPMLTHAACRHLRRDWKHAELEDLLALYECSDLLIGVDSGPYHFAALSDLPTMGIWRYHHPNHCSLPRKRVVNLVQRELTEHWRSIRHEWNLVEYSSDEPSAQFIAEVAQRMLAPPSFFSADRLGREVQLYQLLQLVPDRTLTWRAFLSELSRRFDAPALVETGCIRCVDDWSAGYSTYLFSLYLSGKPAGFLHSVDNCRPHLELAKAVTSPISNRIEFHHSDSVAWLTSFASPIDAIYLDSLDADQFGHDEHALAEIKAAYPKLHSRSLVLIDDTSWNGEWIGKGRLVIPWLLSRGWSIVAATRQVLLSRSM